MILSEEVHAEAKRRWNHESEFFTGRGNQEIFVSGAEWYAARLSDGLHEYWNTAPIEELRQALAFQGAMTRVLLEEQEKWYTPRKVEFTDEQVEDATLAAYEFDRRVHEDFEKSGVYPSFSGLPKWAQDTHRERTRIALEAAIADSATSASATSEDIPVTTVTNDILVRFYATESDEGVSMSERRVWLTDQLSSRFEPGNDFDIVED